MPKTIEFVAEVDSESKWVVDLTPYKGRWGINAREWYYDHSAGEWRPGRSGMRLTFNGLKIEDPLSSGGRVTVPAAVINMMAAVLGEAEDQGF